MKERSNPIAFWKYDSGKEKKGQRWLEASLQKGTTPTVRNPGIDFLNYQHPVARKNNFGGQASILDNRYKLILSRRDKVELYDLLQDTSETQNLAEEHPQITQRMTEQLRQWQASVEISLTGADY
jgi:hypothetical protein